MASEKIFEGVPAFPDDVPTAKMVTISLGQLRAGERSAAREMLQACQELGFFVLQLHGDPLGETLVQDIDQVFLAMREILNLPGEIKQSYVHNIPKSFLGYVLEQRSPPLGPTKASPRLYKAPILVIHMLTVFRFKPHGEAKTETNQPDRFEWFNLGQDGLLGNEPLQPVPDLVRSYITLFKSFLKHGQTIVSLICESLAQQLGLPSTAFTALQPLEKPSGTVVRLIKADPSPDDLDLRTSMIHHTDFGTVTLLANVLGGLQILTPGRGPTDTDAWRYVRPKPKCLIVNLGDAMVQWSGHLLRSNMHRIHFAPGEQRFVERYSAGILVRPEKNASMRRLVTVHNGADSDGCEGLTAWEWEVKRMMALKRGEQPQSEGGKIPIETQ